MNRAAEQLLKGERLSEAAFLSLLTLTSGELAALRTAACDRRDGVYGRRVFLRGLIEISNHCRRDCRYCGIRRSNGHVSRYRLSPEDILACCEIGYEGGLRSFVLQGGEDAWITDEWLTGLLTGIKARFPDCALTLSLGERSRESYARLRRAGADRYLLRHETADPAHYKALHPAMSFENRMDCLRQLKELGYQVGCGFLVGSPGQRPEHLARDLAFLQDFRPHMVGLGPFLPHRDTPFAQEPPGSTALTLTLLTLVRLLLPNVLLPATTALGTAAEDGQWRGLRAGANVLMPNLSPPAARERYTLYDGRKGSGDLAALKAALTAEGYDVSPHRGDATIDN